MSFRRGPLCRPAPTLGPDPPPPPIRPPARPAAVTRAKNAVVFFDRDPAARAPFYYYLARLGLARVVTGTPQMVRGPARGPVPSNAITPWLGRPGGWVGLGLG